DARQAEVDAAVGMTLRALARAERVLDASYARRTFSSIVVQNGARLFRAGLLAALAIPALLGALGLEDSREKRRSLHLGWAGAAAFGLMAGAFCRAIATVPASTRETVLGASSLVGGLALLLAALRARKPWPPAVLVAVSFVASLGAAFDVGTFFAS